MDAALVQTMYVDAERTLIQVMKEMKIGTNVKHLTDIRRECVEKHMENSRRQKTTQILSVVPTLRCAPIQKQFQMPMESMQSTTTTAIQVLQVQHDETISQLASLQPVRELTFSEPSMGMQRMMSMPSSTSVTTSLSSSSSSMYPPLIPLSSASGPMFTMNNDNMLFNGGMSTQYCGRSPAKDMDHQLTTIEVAHEMPGTEIHLVPATFVSANDTETIYEISNDCDTSSVVYVSTLEPQTQTYEYTTNQAMPPNNFEVAEQVCISFIQIMFLLCAFDSHVWHNERSTLENPI